MTVQQMRDQLIELYKNETWRRRVAQMSDRQIMAIYQKQILEKGKNNTYRRQ